jgi:ABC-type sugar transport system permease subunit
MERFFPGRYTKYYMLLPTVFYFLLIGIFPLVFSFILSFFHWNVAASQPKRGLYSIHSYLWSRP